MKKIFSTTSRFALLSLPIFGFTGLVGCGGNDRESLNAHVDPLINNGGGLPGSTEPIECDEGGCWEPVPLMTCAASAATHSCSAAAPAYNCAAQGIASGEYDYYKFVAPDNGRYRFKTTGTDVDTYCRAYSSLTSCTSNIAMSGYTNDIDSVAGNRNCRATPSTDLVATTGVTYYFKVWKQGTASSYSYGANLTTYVAKPGPHSVLLPGGGVLKAR